MPKDTVNTEETIENPKVPVKTRARIWWDTNKTKLKWFGIGALTGAGTVVAAAVLAVPSDEEYEGDDEETVVLDFSQENAES